MIFNISVYGNQSLNRATLPQCKVTSFSSRLVKTGAATYASTTAAEDATTTGIQKSSS